MEEGLTGIRERMIPDTGSLQEPAKERPAGREWPEITARNEVTVRRLSESHPEAVAETQL